MNVIPFVPVKELAYDPALPLEEVLSQVADVTTVRAKAKNSFIYFQGEHADCLFYLTRGRVKITNYSNDGRGIIKEILMEGSIFGEGALTGEKSRRDFAVAMDDEVSFVMLKIDEVQELMRFHPAFGLKIAERLSLRVASLEDRIESLLFKKSRTRIQEYLVKLARQQNKRVGEEYLVTPFLTHQEIARMTDTSRQTVTAVLNDLKKRNLVWFDRRRLLIRDLESLECHSE
ncbi:MAG: Crp/Fnr family transcriptional regulator [Bacteroidia bacterium]|nr:Crp/Fnr family transcriptional regulator [Bacteroidia bacterium]